MILFSISSASNIGHASEEQPSMELLELLGQFDQQDEAWVNNELGVDNEAGINNELPQTDKDDSSELINE